MEFQKSKIQVAVRLVVAKMMMMMKRAPRFQALQDALSGSELVTMSAQDMHKISSPDKS